MKTIVIKNKGNENAAIKKAAEILKETLKKITQAIFVDEKLIDELIKDLQWNFDDAGYKAPEETLQWERTMKTLEKHIPTHSVHPEPIAIIALFTHR